MDGGQRQVAPFRESTRQKIASVGTMTYSLGGTQFLTLPKVGYMSKVLISFRGSVTYSAASTAAKFAPFSILRNVQLDLNSGKQILANCSGYDLFLLNSIKRTAGRTDQQTDADWYVYPVAAGPLPLNLTWEIPVSVSDGRNFQVGLINLQAPELQCNLTLNFLNALTDLGTNISALSGTVEVEYEYYEIPDPTAVQQPPIVLHKILSQPQAVLSTGENVIEVPRGGTLLRLIHTLELNGARSDSWDNWKLRLNKTQDVYKSARWSQKFRAREMYGYNMPVGTIVGDFQNAWDVPEESDLRDAFNTEQVTTTETIVTVTAGATLGSNNNFIHLLREFIQIPV